MNFRGKNGLLGHFSEDCAARTDLAHQAVEADFAEQLSSRVVISKAANGASGLQQSFEQDKPRHTDNLAGRVGDKLGLGNFRNLAVVDFNDIGNNAFVGNGIELSAIVAFRARLSSFKQKDFLHKV